MELKHLLAGIFAVFFCAAPILAADAPLELKKGDHIAIIGGVIGDRMQHDGWLETLIHARFALNELVFRNLAVSGDEINFRHRSENFGSPDKWLTQVKADVIFAFFGYNESFKGKEGLEPFKGDLDKFIKATLKQNYSGKGAPRLVLFSPAADEKHQDPNFPDPAGNNANIAMYTAAMAEVAKANGVQFVDLFTPSKEILAEAAKAKQSLTVNGHYLTELGNKAMAPAMFQGLFGETAPTGDLEKLRAAVNEKNAKFHGRYRTVDGYNVYGGRSSLPFEDGKGGKIITNFKIMQEEMAQRDAQTANRDKKVWAAANGKELAVDDSDLPPVTTIKTNRPGALPDGSHTFLGGEAAISKMSVHSGMKVNLFASEEQWPELSKPVQMAWDTKGRLWVAAWPSYPERTPTSTVGDKLLIFEDTDGDGKADKCTTFLDNLNCPTGFNFYKDGVLVMQAPDLIFARDTDGDGKADYRERILMGMDSADSHHTTNALSYDPGGAVYLSDGVFHRTQVETSAGPVRTSDGAIFRFEPRTGKFETYTSYGFANPHGKVFDYWGNDLITDATGNNTYYGTAFSGQIDFPNKHKGMKEFWNRPNRPCPGTGILTSRHFPEEFQGNFFNINVISFQGIYRVKVSDEGSGLKGETLENLISSTDPNFRPICISTGPDGAIYFCDWHNPIIGHMQHHIRDPNRDHVHGRIYRITYNGRPLMKPAKIDGQPIAALLDLLKEPENQTRELAKIELGRHDSAEVIGAVKQWIASLDKSDAAYEHHMTEALWVHQWMNVVDADLLKRNLRSPDAQARAAATRVLCYWRDRVPEAIALLKTQAVDENPRVRLHAVRAASFFKTGEAVDIALASLKLPRDYYLDYCLGETMRQLEPYWRKAIATGQPIGTDNPEGLNYLIGSLRTTELMKLPKTMGVVTAIISRSDVTDADRNEALNELAKLRNMSRPAALLTTLESAGNGQMAGAGYFARMLPLHPPADLQPVRGRIEALLAATKSAEIRPALWGALALADGNFDKVWESASQSPTALTELLSGIPIIYDPDIRALAYARVKPLLALQMPEEIMAMVKGNGNSAGRYVRIELPRKGTLTLAEVVVSSENRNVARGGKARQSSIGSGGEPSRAIDGRMDGAYGSGTQTHTQENENNPWWEVDLGGVYPIDWIAVYNRTDGDLGKRLDGFTLTVLDGNRGEVFKQTGIPAPDSSMKIALKGDSAGALRRAAIHAAVSMNTEPAETFKALAALVDKREQVTAAARGLRALPRKQWPKAEAGAVARSLVAWAKGLPAGERTSQESLEAIQFANDLAGQLPADQAAALRKELKDIRVAVFVLTTVREQMRYDTTRLVVEAGKPFEVIFENTDFMPHNLVFVTPGSRAKVGAITATMKPEDTDGRGRLYVPNIPEIFAATKLLESGQKQRLQMTAPIIEGDYDYVCTYPGHWELMWGRLVVTKDVDAYLAAHPDYVQKLDGAPHKH